MTRAEALRKAVALLRLARRPGTAGEAAAATAAAQRIMEEWRFEAATLEAAPDAEAAPIEAPVSGYDSEGGWVETRARAVVWRSSLVSVLARFNGCFTFNSRRGRGSAIELVGPPSACELVRELFAWVAPEIERLCDERGRGLGAIWRREFAEGAVSGVRDRLQEERDAAAREAKERAQAAGNAERGLVVVNAALMLVEQQAHDSRDFAYKRHKLRSGGARYARRDLGAQQMGRAAGRQINVGAAGRARLGGGQ